MKMKWHYHIFMWSYTMMIMFTRAKFQITIWYLFFPPAGLGLLRTNMAFLRISVQSVWKISLKYEMWGKYFSVSSGHCRPVLPPPAAPDVKIFIERFLRRPLWAAWITNGKAGPGRLNQFAPSTNPQGPGRDPKGPGRLQQFAPSTINQPTRIKIWPMVRNIK